MTSFPAVKGKDLKRCAAQDSLWFEPRAVITSFAIATADGRATVVPVHAGETLGPGLLASILRDLKLTREQLQKLL